MTKLLSHEQIDQYHNSGFVSPINILNDDEITKSLNEIESFEKETGKAIDCLLYTSPSPRDRQKSRMPSSA